MAKPVSGKYNMLTVVEEMPRHTQPGGGTVRMIRCSCECGGETTLPLSHLVHGRVKSCGCLMPLHGQSGSKLHTTWRGMMNRVKPNAIDSHRYYDRGIKVCDEWKKYPAFSEWARSNGYVEGLTIDRIDNDNGYFPGNCRFVTQTDNANNRSTTIRVTYKGEHKSIRSILNPLGKGKHTGTIMERIGRGWNVDEAIDTPIRVGNYGKRR
jgi:hypothetical protein